MRIRGGALELGMLLLLEDRGDDQAKEKKVIWFGGETMKEKSAGGSGFYPLRTYP